MDYQECSILGVNISCITNQSIRDYIINNIKSLKGSYICISNVHTTVTAFKNPNYLNVQNGATFRFPDGAPLSKTAKKRGYKNIERVTGPDFMNDMIEVTKIYKFKHVFYGSTQETLDKIKEKIYVNMPELAENFLFYSPPFKKNVELENDDVLNMINSFSPDFIWVGLGAPKQENWMYLHKNKLNGLCVGVGAAFDYYAGNIKRAPKWMQKMALEWLYRLMQNPKLFKRYISTNISYIWNANILKK